MGDSPQERRFEDHWPPPDYYQSTPTQYWGHQPAPIDPIKEIIRAVKALLWSTSFLVFICMLTLSVAILFALTPDIQGWITTPSPSTGEIPSEILFVILPMPVGLLELTGVSFQFWHLLMLSILAACFFYGVYSLLSSWFSEKGNAIFSLTSPERAKSGLEGVGKLFMAVSFFSLVYYVFLGAGGVTPETPGFEELSTNELLYRLFNASVYEEIISRMLLIGLPLFFIALVLRWKPPYLRFLLGGRMHLNIITIVLIFISALIFAFAHTGSWDVWKVPQVFVSGMALGYAFVRYGLFSSILLHFSVNFVTSAAIEMWPDNFTIMVIVGLAILLWVIAGCYFFMDYSYRFAGKLKRVFKEVVGFTGPEPSTYTGDGSYHPQDRGTTQEGPFYQQPYAQQPPQDPMLHQRPGQWPPTQRASPSYPTPIEGWQQQWHRGFVCPFCGNISAKYEDKKLICMKCGQPALQHEDEQEDERY